MTTRSLTPALEETLAVFETADRGTPLTTGEVAGELDVGRRSTYDRLERLAEAGRVETKQVGARGRVWWQTLGPGANETAGPQVNYVDLIGEVPGMVYQYWDEPDGSLEYVSDACTDVLGYDETALRQGPDDWRETVVHPDDVEQVRSDVAAGLDETGDFTVRYRVRDPDGETRWVWEHGHGVDDTGLVEGVVTEITEQRRTETALRESERMFRSLVDSVDEYAIFMLDVDGRVQTWNAGARSIKGYEAEDVVGEHFETFYTEGDRADDVPGQNLAAAARHGSIEDEGWRVRQDGTRFWANVTISAVEDDDGTLVGYAKVTRDMTDRRDRERRVQRERDYFDRVLENSPSGIAVFDPSGTADRFNQRFAELVGLDDGDGDGDGYELGDQTIRDENGDPVPYDERPAQRTLATGEGTNDQRFTIDTETDGTRWVSIDTEPLLVDGESWVVVTLTDVTQLERQARELLRRQSELEAELADVFARVDDAFYALDDDRRFTYVNERAAELFERTSSDLLGSHVRELFPGSGRDVEVYDRHERAMETQERWTHEEYVPSLDRWLQFRIYPSEGGLSVYFSDVTERKRREQELEEYERIIETVGDGVYVVDSEGTFTFANEAYAEMMSRSRDALVGQHVSAVVDEDVVETGSNAQRALQAGDDATVTVEANLRGDDGDPLYAEATFALLPGDEDGKRVGVVRDVTDRVERERELERYETILETVDDGVYVLDEEDRFALVNDAYVELTGFGREELLGAHCSLVHDEDIARTVEALSGSLLDGDDEHALVESGLCRADGGEVPTESKLTALDGVEVDVRGTVGVVRDVTERTRREGELERQRERLAALNDLNAVVRGITEDVIEQSTREEIEQSVCDGLAETDSYRFAWIGDVDSHSQELRLKAEAGVENYLGGVTISVDPEDEHSVGPTGRAVLDHEMQVTQDARTDASYEAWHEQTLTYDYRASAAIPILHEESLYGVLNVYADRVDAFVGDEGEMLGYLGEVVGHAIAAVERKRALMSDEVVELEFQMLGVFEELGVESGGDGEIRIDRTVPVDDESYVVYGTVSEDMVDALEGITEALPHWYDLTLVGESARGIRFEVKFDDPPVLSAVTAHGGHVEEAIVRDDDYYMTIHLPPSASARTVIERVQQAYPAAQLLSRRQISNETHSLERLTQALSEELTDRQRLALETAFFSGYFEWPRRRSGEEVADSLGITSPTFHQHLRKAHQRFFEAVFVGDSTA
ncbi:PAS domain S-box protein [Haloarchaeobius sp. HRN-SO-5]|uniref:PAS domain S-box protein n=1 Tax=Haloarchaeobius sp. HRN-SO-5 TaxID=3446118 RepID=UPI003EBAB70E